MQNLIPIYGSNLLYGRETLFLLYYSVKLTSLMSELGCPKSLFRTRRGISMKNNRNSDTRLVMEKTVTVSDGK